MSDEIGCTFVMARTKTRVITCGCCKWCRDQEERELALRRVEAEATR